MVVGNPPMPTPITIKEGIRSLTPLVFGRLVLLVAEVFGAFAAICVASG